MRQIKFNFLVLNYPVLPFELKSISLRVYTYSRLISLSWQCTAERKFVVQAQDDLK